MGTAHARRGAGRADQPLGGYRWGPVLEHGAEMSVLPASAPFDNAADAPQPLGLVGSNRSRRTGGGAEFAGIRPFHAGDRLRRINWRLSLRTGDSTWSPRRPRRTAGAARRRRAGRLRPFGRVGGAASSLDVTMRAASALAEHFVRNGDRVALRVVSGQAGQVGQGRDVGTCGGSSASSLSCVPPGCATTKGAPSPTDDGRHGRHRAVSAVVRGDGHGHRDPARRGFRPVVDTLPEHVGPSGRRDRPAGGRPGLAAAADQREQS